MVQPPVVLRLLFGTNPDLVAHFEPQAGDVACRPILHGSGDVLHVPLPDEAPRPGHGWCQTHSPNKRVQAALKLLEQVVDRVLNAPPEGAPHVDLQLLLLDVEVVADPLLLQQLPAIGRGLSPTMCPPRRLQAPLDQSPARPCWDLPVRLQPSQHLLLRPVPGAGHIPPRNQADPLLGRTPARRGARKETKGRDCRPASATQGGGSVVRASGRSSPRWPWGAAHAEGQGP
mmetsp:Transcript_128098/g.356476  ORF Transcript_128098/g.356476 Transcript_128098/m.356476 type:complete len:230 (-) Transcript_128098:60-749(-)